MDAPSIPTRDLPSLSKQIEKVVEYRFLAEVTAELFRRRATFDVLRGEVDAHGHDIVIEVDGLFRHIQLKATVHGGKRASVTVNVSLAAKPSGCVVWAYYNPADFSLLRFRWFGGPPGNPLPLAKNATVAKHTRPNVHGKKAERPNHRVVKRDHTTMVENVTALVDLLFGSASGSPGEAQIGSACQLSQTFPAEAGMSS